jgi:O-antigen/teichoic acid export membrane protein
MSLVTNIAATLCSRLLLIGFALASSVFLARFLGAEGRGLFALVLLLPSLAKTFALLGFEEANSVYAGLEARGRNCLVWHSAAVALCIGGVVAASSIFYLVMGAPGFPELLQAPLWLYVLTLVTIPVALMVDYWWAILRGMNHILLGNAIEVVTKAASLLMVLLFVGWWRLGLGGAVWAGFILDFATLLGMILVLRFIGLWGWPRFDWPLWKRTAIFALPAHGGNVAAYLNYRVDEFIIAALLPPEQLGFYVIAVGLVERLWLLPAAVGRALLPHITNSSQPDPALPAMISRHVVIWTGAACVVIWVFAEIIIDFLYSSEFLYVVEPLRWLLPGIFALSIGKVLVTELLARQKPYYSLCATGIAVTVNVLMNLLLVPHLGIVGAAIASTISYSMLSIMITWCYLRETGVAWRWLLPSKNDVIAYRNVWREYRFSSIRNNVENS